MAMNSQKPEKNVEYIDNVSIEIDSQLLRPVAKALLDVQRRFALLKAGGIFL